MDNLKASELIAILQMMIKEHGDHYVGLHGQKFITGVEVWEQGLMFDAIRMDYVKNDKILFVLDQDNFHQI